MVAPAEHRSGLAAACGNLSKSNVNANKEVLSVDS
jgi:hypothetical protein